MLALALTLITMFKAAAIVCIHKCVSIRHALKVRLGLGLG